MLIGAINNKRIANAYLFLGPDEDDMRRIASAFAAALNCEDFISDSCGKCKSCSKIKKNVHPDILIVQPEVSSVKIEQIRDLITYTRFGPSEGKFKVCIVESADLMTTEAANSFLKTLEEPLQNIVFILIASSGNRLPRTILSRCQKILFSEDISEKSKAADNEVAWIYNELQSVPLGEISKTLKVSSRIYNDSGDLEDTLEKLINFFWETSNQPCKHEKVKAIFSALSSIKRRANAKLALDVMCLKIGEAKNE